MTTHDEEPAPSVAARLDEHLRRHPRISERLHRELLMELHRRGFVTVDAVEDETRRRAGESAEVIDDPNQVQRDRLGERERELMEQIIREYAARHFTIDEIDDLVNLTLKREEVQSLEYVAALANVSFRELAEKIHRFCELPLGEKRLDPAEVMGTRVALIRHLISDQLEFIGIAKNHLRIRDFDDLTRRMIGSDSGMGRIGGKAGGMLLAYRILADAEEGQDPYLPVAIPESYFLRSDVVEDFLHLNRLDQYQSQKYKPIEDVAREYPLIRGVFRNGDFPLKIVHALREVLERIGEHPLIVRSSSLLEDRFGTAFSGKYASVYVANQGTLEQRLRALLGAIAEVYASTLAPDPILYRREHNLIDYVEEMAVLIQKVVGVRVGDYLFPPVAGVAFSRNEYRWSPRIRREDGMMRLVMGLGTRAVDRGGSEYPRMVALGAPTVRPESSVEEIVSRAQRTLDAINLVSNRLESVRLTEMLSTGAAAPMIDKVVSYYRDGELYTLPGEQITEDPSRLHITFDKLIRSTPFVERIRGMLAVLEKTYGMPVDLEFATDGRNLYVLQCRTLSQALSADPVPIPAVPETDVIFDAHRYIRTGCVNGIEYVVYVDPAVYDAVPSRERRIEIARVVGRVNRALKPKSFVLVGPGRWGSNDLLLGVPVTYADINHCAVLIEVARQKDGFAPEVSFGTHFFQDLIEEGIHYLPLYPDEPGNRFNQAFFNETPNALASILPADAEFEREVRVIHVPACTDGRTLTLIMNGEEEEALAFLA
ncbi:MAG: pyruvate, phosphate dikinase [Planctomycetota bacterium]|nr:MAG: pyruvate, phosphate dikinase [Planctomycetota bacterium]